MTTLAINLNADGTIKNQAGATHVTPSIAKNSDTEYTVTGVIGIASEGWRTSIPTGDDGLPMFTASFEQLSDGVKVTTSKPIPSDRVLTLRFDVEPAPETETETEPTTDEPEQGAE